MERGARAILHGGGKRRHYYTTDRSHLVVYSSGGACLRHAHPTTLDAKILRAPNGKERIDKLSLKMLEYSSVQVPLTDR